MSAETLSYNAAHWPLSDLENLEDAFPVPQLSLHDELDQQAFLTGAFPMVLNGELDPWIMDHFAWNGEPACKPDTASQQNSHLWDETCLGQELGKDRYESSTSEYHESAALLQASEGYPMMSQLATERALFMTPSPHQLSSHTFPGSPISDPCCTPETSYSSSIMWEPDRESEDVRASRSPTSAMTNCPSFGASPYTASDDDCLTTLEMPDGSLRMSSNWLPVDTTAGFTIGSHTAPGRLETEDHMHIGALDDIREAFISASSANWKYDK